MFAFKVYERRLRCALELHGARMSVRRGIVVRSQDALGQWGYGDIAPLPGFGTETFEEALAACQELVRGRDNLATVDVALPAVRSGLSMTRLVGASQQDLAGASMALLVRELDEVLAGLGSGYRTFKLKVGRRPAREEWELYARMAELLLPQGGRLRLDVNKGWTPDVALFWADHLDPRVVEFVEQPFDGDQIDAHRRFLNDCPVPVALDESVSTAAQAIRVADPPTCW
ncbi:MAG TPA: enolase C-terminal domain-like protein [Opitutales bacterium]|nr:enolase C-terminal domain-like protein [Opitutales bacterium]